MIVLERNILAGACGVGDGQEKAVCVLAEFFFSGSGLGGRVGGDHCRQAMATNDWLLVSPLGRLFSFILIFCCLRDSGRVSDGGGNR